MTLKNKIFFVLTKYFDILYDNKPPEYNGTYETCNFLYPQKDLLMKNSLDEIIKGFENRYQWKNKGRNG